MNRLPSLSYHYKRLYLDPHGAQTVRGMYNVLSKRWMRTKWLLITWEKVKKMMRRYYFTYVPICSTIHWRPDESLLRVNWHISVFCGNVSDMNWTMSRDLLVLKTFICSTILLPNFERQPKHPRFIRSWKSRGNQFLLLSETCPTDGELVPEWFPSKATITTHILCDNYNSMLTREALWLALPEVSLYSTVPCTYNLGPLID